MASRSCPTASFEASAWGLTGKRAVAQALGIVDEEFGEDLALPGAESAGEHMETSLRQLRTDELGVIDVEAPEGEPIACAPPDSIVVIEAAPEAFVLLAITKVAEE